MVYTVYVEVDLFLLLNAETSEEILLLQLLHELEAMLSAFCFDNLETSSAVFWSCVTANEIEVSRLRDLGTSKAGKESKIMH